MITRVSCKDFSKVIGKGKIFVISGPSGSGKTTLLEALLRSPGLKAKLVKSISFTTRSRRSGEKEGRDYFFLSAAEFQAQRKRQKILEWTRYLGYDYATPKEFVERQIAKGKSILLCLDLKGARSIKQLYPGKTVAIFILPPSLDTLSARIEQRCSRTKKDEIHQRLRLAKKELSASGKYDYCLTNRDFPAALRQLKKIISQEITRMER